MGQVSQNKRALLITGTIIPNSNFITHTDAKQRRDEYYSSLVFYANTFRDDSLFFLENSSYDFSKDKEFEQLLSDKKITLLKFAVSDKFNEGKGYQEFKMLDAAVNKLEDEFRSFIKITGRYKVLNLKKLTDFYFNGLVADSHKKHKVTQTNVFYVSRDFYKDYITNLFLKADDSKGVFIEKVVYERIQSEGINERTRLFSSNPIIIGISGSYGGTVGRNKLKMIARNMERFFLSVFKINQFLIEY